MFHAGLKVAGRYGIFHAVVEFLAQLAKRTSSHVFQIKEQTPPEGGVWRSSRKAAYSCTIDMDAPWLDVSMQTIFALVVDLTAASTLIA